jgi:glycosyltransferase involved in cell wall biosynthesis
MCVDGRNGVLVEPGRPERLAEACARVLADPALRARLGAAGRELARERYDIRVQAGRLADLYRTLIAR